MNSMQEQPPPWLSDDQGYPADFRRAPDYKFVNLQGELFGHVSRQNVRRLRGARRDRAVVIRRQWHNRRPLSFEGWCVRESLGERGWAPYADVLRAVERWAPDEPEAFLLRAVNDKSALVSVLIRLDPR